MLLLHGFTQTGRSWDPVRALLAPRETVAPDLPGHGLLAERRPVSFDAVLGYVDAVAPAGAFPLAGYSMGGRIALLYALARPARVTRLTLIGASPGMADPAERDARRRTDEELAERLERDGVERWAEEWGTQPLFADQPPAVATAAHRDRLRQTSGGLAAALRGLGTGVMEPAWERLAELAMPVLLTAGERDPKFAEIAARMAAAIPGARVELIPGAGHAAHLEAPDAVAALL